MKNDNPQTLAALADRLGTLAAAAAEIDTESKALKAELILAGAQTVEGALFRATVSHCPGKTTTDWRAVAEALGAQLPADLWENIVDAATTTGTPYSTVRVSARKGA